MTNPLALGLAPLPIPSALRRQLHSLRQGQRLRARPLAGFALLMASISIALSACSSQAATGKAVIVQVLDASSAYPQGRFSPDKIVVNPGTKVIWVMDTGAVDSVTGDSGKWGSLACCTTDSATPSGSTSRALTATTTSSTSSPER